MTDVACMTTRRWDETGEMMAVRACAARSETAKKASGEGKRESKTEEERAKGQPQEDSRGDSATEGKARNAAGVR